MLHSLIIYQLCRFRNIIRKLIPLPLQLFTYLISYIQYNRLTGLRAQVFQLPHDSLLPNILCSIDFPILLIYNLIEFIIKVDLLNLILIL